MGEHLHRHWRWKPLLNPKDCVTSLAAGPLDHRTKSRLFTQRDAKIYKSAYCEHDRSILPRPTLQLTMHDPERVAAHTSLRISPCTVQVLSRGGRISPPRPLADSVLAQSWHPNQKWFGAIWTPRAVLTGTHFTAAYWGILVMCLCLAEELLFSCFLSFQYCFKF